MFKATNSFGGKIMFCQKCGSELNEGVAFCQNCGAPVAPVEPQAQAQYQQNESHGSG